MNYAGKFDAATFLDGQGSNSPAYVHFDSFAAKPFIAKAHGHVPDGAFVVPDPNLIFNGEFKRSGLDLVLSHDGREFVVHDYFRGDKRAAIASPDGAHLTGDIVNALTGHVQVAQAAPGASAAQVIGHVTKLSGSATAIRNGVSVILNNGDNVEKGDVVSTGADSTLGITFIDGTVFGLSSNARMVLNEMVYDPNGSSNSSLLSLVAGTITFVAGETAKHGDMKVDTPVATMGIRGTAVLTQINFVVPAGGGDPQPQASFQVLVEPNGTTGSYILFDKVTLLPIATVNQAGQMIQISGGNVSISNALMSPEVQKLITDVFTLKFTDNNTNTKLTTNFTDTITPFSQDVVFKSGSGLTAVATFVNLSPPGQDAPQVSTPPAIRIPGQPIAQSFDLGGNVKTAFALTERADTTGDTQADTVSGLIRFVDQNLGDRPTVSVSLAEAPNYVYKNAGQQDVTGSLTALQKQGIAATQIQISVIADPTNENNGSAVWTYTIPDKVFDFLAAGETLTLTYMVRVDTNFTVDPESRFIPITITVTGTNDKPVITTSVPVITFEGGTSIPGGPLTSDVATSGTLNFDDVDLTDQHSVSVALTSATLPGGSVPPGPLAAFQSAMSVAIAAGADSTGDGTGTINWSLADLPVYLADFIPEGAVFTLVYTVTLTDSQGATSQQTITVTITGTDAPAVVWIATEKPGAPSGGFWKDAANWATGTVPTSDDDVIVITDQLHGLTPSYPVTIDVAAFAHSLTLDDYDTTPGHKVPEVINKSTLTIGGKLTLNADAKFTNTLGSYVIVGGAIDVQTITRKTGVVVTNTSTITNAGTLTLQAGGTIDTLTAIANSGMIDLSGGTLVLKSDVANTGDGTVQVGADATLIVDGAVVDGGTVAILGTLEFDGTSLIENGTLTNSGTVNVKGTAELADETVDNASSGVIEVLANGWLTIHQGSAVTNAGQIIVDAYGRLVINDATIGGAGEVIGTGGGDEGPVLNAGLRGAGTITANGEIDLTGGAVLSDGILNNNAVINVTGSGNALSNETVVNVGTIEVFVDAALTINQGSTIDNSSGDVVVDDGALLTLDDASISGGAIQGTGTIDVIGASKIDGGARVSIDTITANDTLTLDDVAVSGAVITDNSGIVLDGIVKLKDGAKIQGASAEHKGAITNLGTLEIAGAATLLNEVVTNTGHLVKVDEGQTLTLSGTEIDGGTVSIDGTLEATGSSAIIGSNVTNDGTIVVTGGVLTIDAGALHTITNANLIEVTGGAQLKMSGGLMVNNAGGSITLDALSKFYLSDVTINDGSLGNSGNLYAVSGDNTITASVANSGVIEVQAGTLDLAGGITGGGELIVDQGATLQFAGATGSIHIDNSGSILGAGGNAAIHLEQATGSVIDNAGTIGPAVADLTSATNAIVVTDGSVTIKNTGAINGNISVASATFNNNVGGTWTVAGTSVFGNASTIVNAGEIDLLNDASISGVNGLTVDISNSGAIDSWGTTTITGAITNTGTIEVHDGELTLFGSLTGTGSVTVDAGALLTLWGTVTQTVHLAGNGAGLQIDTDAFGGSIADLSVNDTIELSTIKWGAGTSAVYVPNEDDPASGGLLTVTGDDGNSISLTLVGDYRNAHFAGSDEDGHTLITIHADDDAPTFAAGASPNLAFSELANTTGSSTLDPVSGGNGTIHFEDIDLTDRPTAEITDQSVTGLASDGVTPLTLTQGQIDALEDALSVEQTGKNNGTVDWTYSIADSALDFLGEGQTATVVSTITLDDHRGEKITTDVTVTITGKNDAPVVSYVTSDYMNFDGQTIAVGEVPTVATDGVTLAGSVNWNGAAAPDGQVLFYNGNTSTAGFGLIGTVVSGNLEIEVLKGGVDILDTGFALTAGEWHNLALTRGQGTFTLYVDGNAVYSHAGSANAVGSGSDPSYMMIGAASDRDAPGFGSQGFTGSISDVSVWTSALTQTQIHSINFTAFTGAEANLAAYYQLGGGGTTVVNVANPAQSLDLASLIETDAGLHTQGVLAVSDVDATDHVTVKVSQVQVMLDGEAQPCDVGGLSHADFSTYLTVPPGDILNGTANHSEFTWQFNSGGQPFNFLAAGQTLSLQYTIVPSDAAGAGTGAIVTVNITGTNDAPVIDVGAMSVAQNGGSITVNGLSVADADSNDVLTATAVADSGSEATASLASGALTVNYTEPSDGPATDKVAVTVTDAHGETDTVNLIFNLTEQSMVTLDGTSGKDVFFGTGYQDQFVFAANSDQDVIMNFTSGTDKIDLSTVVTTSDTQAWLKLHATTSDLDTLITLSATDTILLKGVANVQPSDFIVHA